MEEADILGDKIAVMTGGRLSCIGTSLHLKSRFGGGFRLSLMAPRADPDSIKNLVLTSPGIKSTFVSETQGLYLFRLEAAVANASALSSFFQKLEDSKASLGLMDMSIGNATLEDVFVNIAHLHETNTADDEEIKALSETKVNFRQRGPTDVTTAQPTGGCCDPDSESAQNADRCFWSPTRYCCDCGCCSCGCVKAESEVKSVKPVQSSAPNSQIYTLFQKNLAFQMRQKGLMCCVIMFPTVFIILVAVLGALVFEPITTNALAKIGKFFSAID
jgi:hypothetical protein